MSKKKTVKLSKKDSEGLMPIIREFNKISNLVTQIMGSRVERKEKKISVMVSRIARPGEKTGSIRVSSVAFSKGFLKKQRKKRKKENQGQSEWDDNFSQRRGTII